VGDDNGLPGSGPERVPIYKEPPSPRSAAMLGGEILISHFSFGNVHVHVDADTLQKERLLSQLTTTETISTSATLIEKSHRHVANNSNSLFLGREPSRAVTSSHTHTAPISIPPD
jgi:hypothetical protein